MSNKFYNKCSENSRSQIVFRIDIFQKLTLGAPDWLITWTFFKNTIILFAVSPKFCISIVFRREIENKANAKSFGGTAKSITVFLEKGLFPCTDLKSI